MAGSPQHVTLVANTVTTLNFDANVSSCRVTNVDGASEIYFTTDGTTAPTVAGTGAEVVTAGVGAFADGDIPTANDSPTVIKLISAGTPKVSVRAW